MHLDMQRRIVRSVVIIVGIAGVAGAGLIAQSARGVGRDFTQAEPRGQFFRMPDLGGGRLGVSVRDVTASDVGPARLPSQAGAWITDVQADSLAAQADLRTGDVVIQFDGERVRSSRQLSRLVAETPAESTVSVLVRRDGDEVAVDVGLRPQNARGVDRWRDLGRLAANMRDFEFPDINVNVRLRPGRLGVRVQNVGDQLATYLRRERRCARDARGGRLGCGRREGRGCHRGDGWRGRGVGGGPAARSASSQRCRETRRDP